MMKLNEKYEVLTPNGWDDFKGIKLTEDKLLFEIILVHGRITSTIDHTFFRNDIPIKLKDLRTGDIIDTDSGVDKIISIKELEYTDVYTLVEVKNDDHSYIINSKYKTKNCDEFAFVRPSIAKKFWSSIRPTLSTGGGSIITSTPNSDEDQFALLWKGANKCEDEYGNKTELGINGFKAYSVDWRAHPDRDEKWEKEERAALASDEQFEREHENKFLIYDETLINSNCLFELEGISPIRKSGQVRWYKEPSRGKMYIVALDPSLGTGGDPAAIQIFEANTLIQIAEWKHNKTSIQAQIRIMADIVNVLAIKCQDSNSVYYSLENNSIGEAALVSLAEYGESNINGIFLTENKPVNKKTKHRKGFNTGNKTKLAACAKLKHLVETKALTVNSTSLVSELKHFVAFGAGYAAKPGEHDDLVMATLLVLRMMQMLKNWHPELGNKMKDHVDDINPPMPFIAMF